jgi:hypothetical protein
MKLYKKIKAPVIAFFGMLTFALTSVTSVGINESKQANNSLQNNSTLVDNQKNVVAYNSTSNNSEISNTTKSVNTETQSLPNNSGVNKFKTILPLDKIPSVSVGVGESAKAIGVDPWGFFKDTAQFISNESIGRMFTQVYVTDYNADNLEKEEGSAAITKANDQCKSDVRKKRGNRGAVSDLSVSVRKEGSVYNCYERVLK